MTTPSAAVDELRDRRVVAVAADDLVAGGAPGCRRRVPPCSSSGRRRQPGVLAGGQQDPHVGVRRDDRGDVAALGHDPAAALDRLGDERRAGAAAALARGPSRLVATAETAAEIRVLADRLGDVGARRPGPRARRGRCRSPAGGSRVGVGHRRPVVEVDALVEAPPGERAVHRAGVEVADAEAVGPRPARRSTCPSPRVRRSRRRGRQQGAVRCVGVSLVRAASVVHAPAPGLEGGQQRLDGGRDDATSASPNGCPSPCSRCRSSRLTPASPMSVNSRPSSPGSSGTTTTTVVVRGGGGAVLARDARVADVAAGRRCGRQRASGARGRRRRRSSSRAPTTLVEVGAQGGQHLAHGRRRCRPGSGSTAGGRWPRSG